MYHYARTGTRKVERGHERSVDTETWFVDNRHSTSKSCLRFCSGLATAQIDVVGGITC